MKNALVVACCVVGFLLIAAPTNVGHQVFINGKPFANAITINGQLFVSLEDFAKASGAKVTLEPFFQLQGSKLVAIGSVSGAAAKIKSDQIKVSGKAWGTNQLFQVVKSGEISSKIVMQNGKAFLPLQDLAKAFGSTYAPVDTFRPNQSINLDSPLHPCPGCSIGAR